MAATAYAAVVSLMNVVNRFQHPACPVSFDRLQMQTILEKVSELVDFLENYYSETRSKGSLDGLERKMTSAAHAAEDIIESSYVHRFLQKKRLDMWPDLQEAIEEMEQIIQQTEEVGAKKYKKDHQFLQEGYIIRPNNIVVGFDQELRNLMDRVMIDKRNLDIIPIVGMGGLGKTTLARSFYNHLHVGCLFDVQAWATISQHYAVKDIIRAILRDINVFGDDEMDDEELGNALYKGLFGRKYFIVLDDIWSTKAWDKIRRFFPKNGNRSRILFTTRVQRVATNVGTSIPYELEFLKDDDSFKLLSGTICGQEVLPRELVIHGKKIARSCKGLPLAIVVIGGLLKVSPKTPEYWTSVEKNVSSIVISENDGQFLEILLLSYNHLPVRLKPCFLYMATFREDYEIRVCDLIKLFVVDGFIRPAKGKILEEVALECLNDLIGRNLIMVGKKGSAGKMETCIVHDSLKELCLREAEDEKFLSKTEVDKLSQLLSFESEAIHELEYGSEIDLVPESDLGSFVCKQTSTRPHQVLGCELLRLLEVLDVGMAIYMKPLVNIRHLQIAIDYPYPSWLLSSVSSLWNLEILIVEGPEISPCELILPSEIWQCPNLRHLLIRTKAGFLDPKITSQNCYVLDNLQTISTSSHFYCSDEMLGLIPNLRELKTEYEMADPKEEDSKLSSCFTNLAHLDKLEIFSASVVSLYNDSAFGFSNPESLNFSPNLRELKLGGFNIPWEHMTIIGSLPYLELLHLYSNAFCGKGWNSSEGEFQKLKCLSIYQCHLEIWNADSSHFPNLEYLSFTYVELKQIPFGIGEIPTLELIELDTFELSAVMSAKEIFDEQQMQGNDDLLFKGFYNGGSDQEKMELTKWSEADRNFQIKYAVSFMIKSISNYFPISHLISVEMIL